MFLFGYLSKKGDILFKNVIKVLRAILRKKNNSQPDIKIKMETIAAYNKRQKNT